MGKTGLVLEGGGMRGLYTAGVIDVMLEKGFRPDVICGTSAGVTFGVNLPSGQKGRVLRYNTTYAGDPAYISMRSLLQTGNMVNTEFAYDRLPNELDPFDNEAYNRSGIDFYATVTDVETGTAEYMRIDDCTADMDIIRASASLPFVSRKVFIGGKAYLDGGIVDNIPLEKCLSLGCDRVVVVLTHPREYVRTGSMVLPGRLFYRKDRKLIEAFALRNERYNRCMEKIRQMEKEGSLLVIAPEHGLTISRLETDPEKMRQVHAIGVRDAQTVWERLEDYLRQTTVPLA